MRARELERLAQQKREAEAVHEPERERDRPPPLDLRANDVLERHVHNREGDQHLDQRWEPERVRGEPACRRNEGDRVRDRERRDDRDERARLAERNHETEDEQDVIDPVENVLDAEYDEAQRGLMPSRIETDEPGITGVLE